MDQISISSCSKEVSECTYHLKLVINEEDYFYIVSTLECNFRDDIKHPIITKIKRGSTYWDCGLRIKNSDKKKVKALIEQHFKFLA